MLHDIKNIKLMSPTQGENQWAI